MKKKQITHIESTVPNSGNTIAAGYNVGQFWDNTTTGDKYFHKTDGVWVLLTDVPTKTSDLINDGDNGISHFISLEDLPSNLVLYATSTASDIGGYSKIVTSITDPSYDVIAVDITTGAISASNQLIASLATSANIIIGNPGLFNVSTIGNIRRTAGSGTAEFYFEVYKRTSGGTETLITTSSNTSAINSTIYSQFSATALWNDGIFLATDRIVLKFYGTKVGGGSDPTYDFQFGGSNPVRTTVPIPLNVVPNINLNDINDVDINTPTNNQVLQYETATQLWKNKTFDLSGYLTVNNPSYTGLLNGVGQTQTGSTAVGVESLSQTWNTTGAPSAFLMNITDTASSALSRLMDLRVDGAVRFQITKGGVLSFGNFGTPIPAIGTAVPTTGSGSPGQTAMYLGGSVGSSAGYQMFLQAQSGTRSATSGICGLVNIRETFNPTSGTATYDTLTLIPTINQGTGATGVSRGFYNNPVITAAADYRAIESTQGKVILTDTLTAVGGSKAGSLLSLNQTWNTTGAPTAISLNVTNTASGTLARLMDLRNNNAPRFTITKDGFVYFGPNGTTTPSIGICNPTTGLQTVSATGVYLGNTVGSAIGYGIHLINQANINRTPTSGVNGTAMIRETFNPISGTGTYDILTLGSVINQTGGANGITRGLRINPIITAAADFRAIESTNGKVILADTLTAVGGANAGSLLDLQQTWNTTGAPNAIDLAITNTASSTSSNFLRFRLSGKNAFRFTAQNATLLLGDGSNNVGIGSALATTGAGSIDGTAMRYSSQPGASTGYGHWFNTIGSRIATSSTSGLINLAETFAPITGTGIYNLLNLVPTINQTGGANGITRGLYINPTLTSAFDFRAIEVEAGKIVFSSTITAPGTTGAQTINKISGKVNAAAGSTSLVVTNNLVTTNSIVMCQLGTNDATCIIKSVVEANGSFTINYIAPTAETVIKFKVIN